MGYRKKKKPYAGYASWREWRNANATALADAGVPTVALESQENWSFFLQEARPELMGGPRFNIEELTTKQLLLLGSLIDGLPEATPGMDLVTVLQRALLKRST